MSDYAPPTGPPPPRVPEGWKAIWNAQYSQYFYVNLYTKESTWEVPTGSAPNPHAEHSLDAPPSYIPGENAHAYAGSDIKKTGSPLPGQTSSNSNNPYQQNIGESDEAMARRLQEEENARRAAGGDRGSSDGYYQGGSTGNYPNQPNYQSQQYQNTSPQYTDTSASKGKSGGLLGKLKDKLAAPAGGHRPMGGAPMMGYGAGGYPSHQSGYGGYPQQGYGGHGYGGHGYGQPMYGGGHGMMGGMGGMGRKKPGMGMGGAAALGVGGGLIGGMMLADGIDDMQDNAYDQGYDQGMDDGGDMGDMGDMGGE